MQRDYNGYKDDTVFCEKLFFFHKSSKTYEKEIGTNFIASVKKHD